MRFPLTSPPTLDRRGPQAKGTLGEGRPPATLGTTSAAENSKTFKKECHGTLNKALAENYRVDWCDAPLRFMDTHGTGE